MDYLYWILLIVILFALFFYFNQNEKKLTCEDLYREMKSITKNDMSKILKFAYEKKPDSFIKQKMEQFMTENKDKLVKLADCLEADEKTKHRKMANLRAIVFYSLYKFYQQYYWNKN
jgi:hypothetical protein